MFFVHARGSFNSVRKVRQRFGDRKKTLGISVGRFLGGLERVRRFFLLL